jgi:hypothetical protein
VLPPYHLNHKLLYFKLLDDCNKGDMVTTHACRLKTYPLLPPHD